MEQPHLSQGPTIEIFCVPKARGGGEELIGKGIDRDMKRERFFAHVYFSNETVSQTTVSTEPMKMFRLGHETMNICQRNVAHFGHME